MKTLAFAAVALVLFFSRAARADQIVSPSELPALSALTERELAQISAGTYSSARYRLLCDDIHTRDSQNIARTATVAMDNWWAADGATLIAANAPLF